MSGTPENLPTTPTVVAPMSTTSTGSGFESEASLTGKWSRVNEAKVDSFIDRARQGIHCSLFCGGVKCKHEDWNVCKDRKNVHPAIEGLNSNWVGDEVIASQRPSTSLFLKHLLIQQFKAKAITGVFNLQEKGEHASCGPDGIYESTGYSYNGEQDLMRHGVHYYEFPWPDMTAPDNDIVLRSVQVMESHVKNSGRVLVHCHAGLGRTGLMIACFLIYSKRMTSDSAIKMVRTCRPGAVQTSAQVAFVKGFEQHLWSMQLAFRLQVSDPRVELELFMKRQREILHGEEGEQYRYVPKPLHFLLCRAISLALDDERHVRPSPIALNALESVAISAAPSREIVNKMCTELNRGNWKFSQARDANAIMFLCADWFRGMTAPVISENSIREILDFMKQYTDEERSDKLKNFICHHYSRVVRHSIGMLLSAVNLLADCASARVETRRFAFKTIAQALTHTHTAAKGSLSGCEVDIVTSFFGDWATAIGGIYFDTSVVPMHAATISKIAAASQLLVDSVSTRAGSDEPGRAIIANDLRVVEDLDMSAR
ncbi:phosphatase, putative [Bodo saltans]|uniref:Phosphatase, putative n=1 Tax=Bodo saltans TaxID=75058 RepID=A0A0S4KLI7_BODSA|nr:phosphatase, putative [Bodo saltans]|eukprot:CUI15485.1 phosphatase, putative [Bodo saltans]